VKPTFEASIADPKDVQVALHGQPLSMSFEIDPEAALLQTMLKQKIKAQGLERQIIDAPESIYRLLISTKQIALYKADELITGIECSTMPELAVGYLVEVIQKVIRWEQINQVIPPKRTSIPIEDIHFNFTWAYPNDSSNLGSSANTIAIAEQATVNVPIEENQYVFYRIEIENRDFHSTYFHLIHLGRKYGISQKIEQFIKPLRYEDQLIYDSKSYQKALGINDPKLYETKDIFLLLISRDPLYAPYLFEQPGLGKHYGKIIHPKDLKANFRGELNVEDVGATILASWFIKRLEVQLTRKNSKL
ncbi:MAG: hypothetical protein AAF705_13440, partial [Bacteroidota bacterium]